MELSLKYAYMVWEKKSFSKAAKALFVSQPSLSATVSKLENELGFKIFDRSNHPVSLTQKGMMYINYLKEIKEAEYLLMQQLKAADSVSQGSLTVGGRMSSAYSVFPIVCGEFQRKYPNVAVTIDINASSEKLKNQTLDILLSFSPQTADYTVIPLLEERLVIAVNKNTPLSHDLLKYAVPYKQIVTKTIPQELEISDVSILRELPFIQTGGSSDSDRRLLNIINEHKVSPFIVTNTHHFDMRYRIMKEGLGAIFVSDLFLLNFPNDEKDIYYFAIKNPASRRTIYIQHNKNTNNSEAVGNFIEIMLSCCQNNKLFLKDQPD